MTQQPPSTTPAGWYQDDTGTTRWWDGAAWTEHTAPVAPVAEPAAATAATLPAPLAAPALAPRNGLGIAALVLGIVGILFGFIPFTFFIAGTLGLIGFILGIVGWRRAKSGAATNKKAAIAGIITSLIAMIMAVVGIVILVSATSDLVDALDGVGGVPGVSASCTAVQYPDQQTTDVCSGPDGSLVLGTVSANASTLTRTTDSLGGIEICSTLTLTNNGTDAIDFNEFDYKLQTPSGEVLSFEISTQSTLGSGQLVGGGTKSGLVCFPDQPGVAGQYVLIYKPNAVQPDRGIWIAPLA